MSIDCDRRRHFQGEVQKVKKEMVQEYWFLADAIHVRLHKFLSTIDSSCFDVDWKYSQLLLNLSDATNGIQDEFDSQNAMRN